MDLLVLIQIIAFLISTIFLITISWKSLSNIKVHGFYRFFVFELIVALIILNLPSWIDNPFSSRQLIAWLCLFYALYPLTQSIILLRKVGGNKNRSNVNANFNFENTENLVSDGIYKYVRHPMYSSLLFLCLGTFLKDINYYTTLITVTIIVLLILTARTEEKENIAFFGESYRVYITRTKMFIPFLF